MENKREPERKDFAIIENLITEIDPALTSALITAGKQFGTNLDKKKVLDSIKIAIWDQIGVRRPKEGEI